MANCLIADSIIGIIYSPAIVQLLFAEIEIESYFFFSLRFIRNSLITP